MSAGIEGDDTIQREKRKNREEEERRSRKVEETKKKPKEKPKRNTGFVHPRSILAGIECRYLTLSTVTMIVMAGAGILHMFSWIDIGKDADLYDTLRNDTWSSYEGLKFLVDPEKILWVWIGVYGLQVIWILSGIPLIFQKTSKGRYLYTEVTLLPCIIHLFMMLAAVSIFGWVLLWNKYDKMRYALTCVGGASLFSYVALLASMLACRTAEPWLALHEKTGVLVLIGLLVQNGLAAFATMSSIMTNFHLSIILNLEAKISPTVTCYVSFGMLLCFIGVYFIIDTCLSDRHSQCVFTPYVLVSLAYVGAYFKITNQPKGEKKDEYDLLWILSLVGGGAAALMLLVKIVVSIMRANKRRIQDRRFAEEERKNGNKGGNRV